MTQARPRIICHMASTIDGKIDGGAINGLTKKGEYEALHAKLNGDAWICGRTTMQQHFAEKNPFVSSSNKPVGTKSAHVARRADSYAICVDTNGKLRWSSGDISGDHLICVLSEQVPADYLEMLREKGISYIVTGNSSVDLADAVSELATHFGIRTLLLEGGGNINGGFIDADLVDEVSLLLAPGIDGRHGIPAVFDGIKRSDRKAVPLKLNSVEQLEHGALWIRYEVVRA